MRLVTLALVCLHTSLRSDKFVYLAFVFVAACWQPTALAADARWPEEDLNLGGDQTPGGSKECWKIARRVRDAHQSRKWDEVVAVATNENFWWKCYIGANAMGMVAERQAFALLQLDKYSDAKVSARECTSQDQWNLACRVYEVAAIYGSGDSSADTRANDVARMLEEQRQKDEYNASRDSIDANYRYFLEQRHRAVRRLQIELKQLRSGKKITEPRPW
jgi:hypothetical protein